MLFCLSLSMLHLPSNQSSSCVGMVACHCSGESWHRMVGSVTAVTPQNLSAEVENAFNIMNRAKPWKYSLSVSELIQPVVAPASNTSTNVTTSNNTGMF